MSKNMLKALAMLLTCAWLASAAMKHYVFAVIGNFPGALVTGPQALNARHIVGYYVPKGGTGVAHGFRQTGSTFRKLEPPNVISSFLEGINDHDVIVGGYCDTNVGCGGLSSQHGLGISNSGTISAASTDRRRRVAFADASGKEPIAIKWTVPVVINGHVYVAGQKPGTHNCVSTNPTCPGMVVMYK
jgi:hypothetical protein